MQQNLTAKKNAEGSLYNQNSMNLSPLQGHYAASAAGGGFL